MKAALTDLITIAPPERVAVLERQAELLTASARAAMLDDRDVATAMRDDRDGIGAAASTDGHRPADARA
jgi:hypothetical protein